MATEQKTSWILTGATVACVLALYVPCVQRTVPGGDSGELITTACELGVAHPPGYPLFTLLSRLTMCLLPTLSPAHSVNLMSSLLGAVACGTLCMTVCRLVGPGPGAALAGGVFAVSRLSWQWSVVAEVFTLNNLFTGLLFLSTASFHLAKNVTERRKLSQWGALCCGLGLCNQHTLVLYVLAVIPWVFHRLHSHRELSLRSFMSMGICFLLGFMPYIFLPFSSFVNSARWSWGDQTTMSGLLTHLLRAEYGTFSLAKTESSVNLTALLKAQLDHLLADLSLPIVALAGLGLLLSSTDRMYRSVSWLLTFMLLIYSFFFAWRANLDISRPLMLGVVERFWIQGDAVVCVLAGLGSSLTLTGLERSLGYGGFWKTIAWVLTTVLLAHMVHTNHRECDQSSNSVVERFGRELLASFPADSIVLTRGDLPGNSLRYLHYCLDVRPDVRLVDQEMMTYSWYVGKLGPHLHGVHFPGRQWDPVHSKERDTFSLERFLIHNSKKDVLACIGLPDGDPSWGRSFSRWPFGVCDFLVPAQRQFHPKEWAKRTYNLYNWSEPHNRFHSASWERVANEEMWQARMKMAFFLFDLAERMQGEAKYDLFELSYTLYKALVESYSSYPPNWDKNLALACERLVRTGHQGHSLDGLLSCSIQHFSLYLDKEPADPQAPAIRSAVAHLLKERDQHRQSLKKTT
ncbi:protein O-mannosyl-transferase TMEM260 isoform X1 [Phycodurus eques]|uniref:protein O-mannosyl-transferase TMEM260 isoform X1 n=1 Tax=Phycodurus eques TaxID=693459 RepID=UPI002ACE85BF|nr:protein O-mannosyl-transferase TMEM260 isoform X1 [Phycodurus eques]XP_061553169.1 protein O-mannosyl-transferase TMEM260 isoform X1 [Phycodurus eques]XP_061553170.1 protein O-mannosyl-transferase TMEM260 isoform X1 [Phycodurus eques]